MVAAPQAERSHQAVRGVHQTSDAPGSRCRCRQYAGLSTGTFHSRCHILSLGAELPIVPDLKAQVSEQSQSTVLLSWNPPKKTMYNENWRYGIYYSVNSSDFFKEPRNITSNTHLLLTGLGACEKYMIDIGVVAPLGQGPLSAAPTTITTGNDPRAPPKRLTAVADRHNDTLVDITWSSSCFKMSEAVGYIVSAWASVMTPTRVIGIFVPVLLVMMLVGGAFVVFIVRHRRLQNSFTSFANSHYSTRSGNATFTADGLGSAISGEPPIFWILRRRHLDRSSNQEPPKLFVMIQKIIDSPQVRLSPKVAVGYGACVDLFVDGKDLLPSDVENLRPRHHDFINDYFQLYESYSYYFQHGAAAE
ncbi:unnamed protein product [Nesidiocoris tenuis]|uniref:Fibronectin type-III domain-containing protein n=1 Tax=Nesidiocoris tenuis TaxID=355587 RepID=A0A6H5FX71_9HEMI|nr:unnamed protein product [Nesidiocoris tenuis]CAA9994255.1 unnamed protein product [Nesidiocoris tenuis]